MNKHTNGPLFASREEKWPFAVVIKNAQGETFASESAYAYSTKAETLSQFNRAVGFDHDQREAVIAANERQMADAKLRAAAPELLDALQAITSAFLSHTQWNGEPPEEVKAARAAIAKATA
jgi:hypothetical protein